MALYLVYPTDLYRPVSKARAAPDVVRRPRSQWSFIMDDLPEDLPLDSDEQEILDILDKLTPHS